MVNSTNVVFQTSYPLYCVRTVGERHVLVAGGGGQAKTGVPNRLEIFLFDLNEGSWDFRKTAIVDTGLEATMNMDIFTLDADKGRFLVACGQEGNCRVYETSFDIAELKDGELVPRSSSPLRKDSANVSRKQRQRSTSSSSSKAELNNSAGLSASTAKLSSSPVVLKLALGFDVRSCFQTDFTPANHKSGGPFQKCVRFSADGTLLITGGVDGHFRVWDIQSGRKMLDHNAHKDDIDDLDCSPDGQRVVTVGRDQCGYLWLAKDATKIADLTKENVAPAKYRFRFCRFSPALCNKRFQTFFTVAIPVVRSSKSAPCYLTRWTVVNEQNSCRPTITKALADSEVVSSFALSADGRYIGLGTLNGSLHILDAHTLQSLKRWPSAHGIFVTALEFLPSRCRAKPQSPFCPLLTKASCALLSVSADDCCQLHVLPITSGTSGTVTFLLFFVFWAFVFYICAFLEL